jgi:hypothetical protein
MYEDELKVLLNRDWSVEERTILLGLINNLTYYKKLVPKSLKTEILTALQMCNKLKTQFDEFQLMKVCECGGIIKLKTDEEIEEVKEVEKEIKKEEEEK